MTVAGQPSDAWTPRADEVHDLYMAARPPFTTSGKPVNLSAAESTIAHAVGSLLAEIGDDVELAARYHLKAKLVVGLHAASLLESNYFPEQQGDGQAERLYTWYQAELLGLRQLLGNADGGRVGARVGTIRVKPGLAPPCPPLPYVG